VHKSHWFPLPTHITIEWYDTADLARQAREKAVPQEKPLFRAEDGTSFLLTDGRYVDTAGLTAKAQARTRNVPDGYWRDADGQLHSRRGRGSGHRFAAATSAEGRELEQLRIKVAGLQARLAKLDVCVTPGCGRKITALDKKMCARCYSRDYSRARAEKAARQKEDDQARRRRQLLAGRPEVYQHWVMMCILEDLDGARPKVL
jgi:hypothetical protein